MIANCFRREPANVIGFDIAPGGIRLRAEPVLRINGYSRIERVPEGVNEAAKRMTARAQAVIQPALSYRLLYIEHLHGSALTLEGGAVLESKEFASALAGCYAVVVAILGIGGRFDNEAKALSASRNALDLLLFETAGWLAIEEITKAFVVQLRDWANHQGYRLTRRLAPGYNQWPLIGQRSLFSLFEGIPLPVRLLESCAMVPTMSRSAMYGLRRNPGTAPGYSASGKHQ